MQNRMHTYDQLEKPGLGWRLCVCVCVCVRVCVLFACRMFVLCHVRWAVTRTVCLNFALQAVQAVNGCARGSYWKVCSTSCLSGKWFPSTRLLCKLSCVWQCSLYKCSRRFPSNICCFTSSPGGTWVLFAVDIGMRVIYVLCCEDGQVCDGMCLCCVCVCVMLRMRFDVVFRCCVMSACLLGV